MNPDTSTPKPSALTITVTVPHPGGALGALWTLVALARKAVADAEIRYRDLEGRLDDLQHEFDDAKEELENAGARLAEVEDALEALTEPEAEELVEAQRIEEGAR